MSKADDISAKPTVPGGTPQPDAEGRIFDLYLINPTEYSEYDAITRPTEDTDWTDLLQIIVPAKLTEWAQRSDELLTGLYTTSVSQDSLTLIHPDCLKEGHQFSDEVKEAFERGVWKGEYEVSRPKDGEAVVSFIASSSLKAATVADEKEMLGDDAAQVDQMIDEAKAVETP